MEPIRKAQEAVAGEFNLFVSTWTAPLWLKDQNFTCVVADGVNVCALGASRAAVNCTHAVLHPEDCLSNKQGEPCPSAPTASMPSPPAPSLWPSGAHSRHLLGGAPSPAPDSPIKNANGNCFNTGFLSPNTTLQAQP